MGYRDRSAICLLARAPSAPGKTRLTEGQSVERAHALRRALLLDTLACAIGSEFPTVVCYTPVTARQEFADLTNTELIPQSDGDLGMRMRSAFEDVFAAGFERVVLIGSDLPTLPPDHITMAMIGLDRVPIVLGPAEDGGYYLIGLREPHPELFDGIAWGRREVLTQTFACAARVGASVELVPAWHDVDEPADLQRVSSSPRAHHTRAWLSATENVGHRF